MRKIIVSLTSYPARIKTVYQVIESIQKQTIQADKILLWLSINEFPNKIDDLPNNLLRFNSSMQVEIRWVEDNLKSHKKYYYALQEFSEDIVITIDDDVYYESTMLETLLKSYEAHPTAISARNVHRVYAYKDAIAPYCSWNHMIDEYEDVERMDLCAIGVGGVLYPPGCSNQKWFDKEKIAKFAQNQDDIWLKFQEILLNIPVVYVKSKQEDYIIKGSQTVALMYSNIETDNDICIDEMLKLFINEQSVKQWIFELQQIEEVLLNKKQVCIRELISYCGQRVSIFGAGINAKSLFLFINKFIPEINVEYFLVSNTEDNFSHICDIPVIRYDSLSEDEAHIVLLGVSNPVIKEIESIMEMLQNYIWVRVDLLTVKQVYRGLSCLEKKKESWYQ